MGISFRGRFLLLIGMWSMRFRLHGIVEAFAETMMRVIEAMAEVTHVVPRIESHRSTSLLSLENLFTEELIHSR